MTDANGRPVYDGCDTGEMFRLYRDETRAERAALAAARRAGRPSGGFVR